MISSLSSGSAHIFFKRDNCRRPRAEKRAAAHRTWLLTDAEASSLPKKRQSSLAEEAPESDQCLIESLLYMPIMIMMYSMVSVETTEILLATSEHSRTMRTSMSAARLYHATLESSGVMRVSLSTGFNL